MKQRNIAAFAVSFLLAASAFAAPLGEVSSANGKIFSGGNYMVVKKDMKQGEKIHPHNHPGFKTLIFAVGKGHFDVTLGGNEKYSVGAGSVLRFGGEPVIEAVATEDSDVAITLIK